MELTCKPSKSFTIFDFEVGDLGIDILLARRCNCGCGYVQIFTFDDCRIDVILRDDAREMYE